MDLIQPFPVSPVTHLFCVFQSICPMTSHLLLGYSKLCFLPIRSQIVVLILSRVSSPPPLTLVSYPLSQSVAS